MPPLWDEPLMLAMVILIALGLVFYLYIMFFVAKFGRGHERPSEYGENYQSIVRTFKIVFSILIIAAVIIVASVPVTFTETCNETFIIDSMSSPLHFSTCNYYSNRTVYTYTVNLEGKPGSWILVNTSNPTDCIIIERLFVGEAYRAWAVDPSVVPYMLVESYPDTWGGYEYLPTSSDDIHLVFEGECLPDNQPDAHLTHYWEVNLTATREVTRKVNETLLRHWLG